MPKCLIRFVLILRLMLHTVCSPDALHIRAKNSCVLEVVHRCVDCLLQVTAEHPEFDGRIRVGDYKQIVKLECVQERDPVALHCCSCIPIAAFTILRLLLHYWCSPIALLSHCACSLGGSTCCSCRPIALLLLSSSSVDDACCRTATIALSILTITVTLLLATIITTLLLLPS